eukprot:m.178393 g.178393  ORF g.178393 m.178393 type:complete len:485 (+) comp14535_c0_seq1:285-1739(+)
MGLSDRTTLTVAVVGAVVVGFVVCFCIWLLVSHRRAVREGRPKVWLVRSSLTGVDGEPPGPITEQFKFRRSSSSKSSKSLLGSSSHFVPGIWEATTGADALGTHNPHAGAQHNIVGSTIVAVDYDQGEAVTMLTLPVTSSPNNVPPNDDNTTASAPDKGSSASFGDSSESSAGISPPPGYWASTQLANTTQGGSAFRDNATEDNTLSEDSPVPTSAPGTADMLVFASDVPPSPNMSALSTLSVSSLGTTASTHDTVEWWNTTTDVTVPSGRRSSLGSYPPDVANQVEQDPDVLRPRAASVDRSLQQSVDVRPQGRRGKRVSAPVPPPIGDDSMPPMSVSDLPPHLAAPYLDHCDTDSSQFGWDTSRSNSARSGLSAAASGPRSSRSQTRGTSNTSMVSKQTVVSAASSSRTTYGFGAGSRPQSGVSSVDFSGDDADKRISRGSARSHWSHITATSDASSMPSGFGDYLSDCVSEDDDSSDLSDC